MMQAKHIATLDKAADRKRVEITLVRLRRVIHKLADCLAVDGECNNLKQLILVAVVPATIVIKARSTSTVPQVSFALPDQHLSLRSRSSRHIKAKVVFKIPRIAPYWAQ